MTFRIKVCGITRAADAELAAAAGADAIGLNFYAKSPRFVGPEENALEIVHAIPLSTVPVGVFVNAPPKEMITAAYAFQLAAIQLHGDEPPETIFNISVAPVIRAFRVGQFGITELSEYLTRCRDLCSLPSAILLDALVPGQFGGTGQTLDFNLAKQAVEVAGEIPVILAGGLTPGNVAAAIRKVRPYGVDVASGVESAPGIKDPELIKAFVAEAQAALAS